MLANSCLCCLLHLGLHDSLCPDRNLLLSSLVYYCSPPLQCYDGDDDDGDESSDNGCCCWHSNDWSGLCVNFRLGLDFFYFCA